MVVVVVLEVGTAAAADVVVVVVVEVVVETSAASPILRQKWGERKVVEVFVVVLVMVVVVEVSASAETTMPQGKKGAYFSTGVLSLYDGVILLQLEGSFFFTVLGHFTTYNNDPGHFSM